MSTGAATRKLDSVDEGGAVRILIAYASKHGSTREVADAIAAALEPVGIEVEVRPARAVEDPGVYDAVVLGAPLYMARWHKDARAFVRNHRKALERLPVAIFALGPVDDDPKHWRDAEQQLEKALATLPEIAPVDVRMFGGAVKPEELRFPFTHMPAADVRDSVAIRAWGAGLPERLGLPAYASSSSPWAMA
jgi:menaquinone-dependent protoporphyrinogen oxidase